MNWPLASLALLALALAAGFAWYERSRPTARVLGLVAALAALAVVGRIAFAPFPNVKPTTDIVLFAGLTLGAAPGFAVGAVTALASNLFFGQGPWTPWQMAAWGGVGVAGAVLGRVVRGRELGRFALAAACGVAGLAFGMVMDLHVWTYAPGHDLASYLAASATSLPFNLAHVVGNVAFCLVAGPALVRALRRYRARFEFSWAPPRAGAPARAGGLPRGAPAAAVLAALAIGVAGLAHAPAAQASAAGDRAARWLGSVQNADGGFGPARGARSTQLYTGWAALGLAATGRNPRDVSRGRRSVLDAIRSTGRGLRDNGELQRTILVLRASGLSPRRFGGRDLRAELVRRRRGDGSWQGLVNQTAFGILALRAAGDAPGSQSESASWLAARQNEDGGFGFSPSAGSDADNTGAAIQALVAGGRGGSETVGRAVAYLNGAQNPDGGFGLRGGSNAQSTAWAIQGLVAAGRNPDAFRAGGRSPLEYLRSLQARDGSVRYSRTGNQTPVWVTSQVMLAFERRAFPLRPVRSRSSGLPSRAEAAAAARRADREARRRRAAGAEADGTLSAGDRAPGAASPPVLEQAAQPTGPVLGGSWALVVGVSLTALTVVALFGMWFRRYWGDTAG